MRLPRKEKQEADLNVTSFMNLMIVLVPVLLLNMVFSQLATLELHLPLDGQNDAVLSEEVSLEVVIRAHEFEITRTFKEETESILKLPKKADKYDYQG
ncbi:MAG TPA: biopolymer transporter ExbD, partial [Pseudomonadales bacterium]|nr:biopolymer transporter ExbD [Pseudomonadales bacterium]